MPLEFYAREFMMPVPTEWQPPAAPFPPPAPLELHARERQQPAVPFPPHPTYEVAAAVMTLPSPQRTRTPPPPLAPIPITPRSPTPPVAESPTLRSPTPSSPTRMISPRIRLRRVSNEEWEIYS
ncbi:hypothetical protein R5R35_004626 [Gryllus longicercus]|uniref:Uncharacterized protein n=1 Tax=Gryllus longicercus TaxID=2509291 RepID=A0AAN9WE81_9ORTH